MQQVCEVLQIQEALEDNLYLNLPCIIKRNKFVILDFLKDMMCKRIQC